MNYIVTMHAEK